MQILMLRHGSAVPNAPRDRDRALNAAGREELNRVLSQCRETLAGVEQIFVSPYLRTQQTLEVAAAYLPARVCQSAQTVDWLTPNGNPQKVLQVLQDLMVESVLLITHQPLVGTLLNDLCAFEPGQYRMGTAALAAVEADPVARGLGNLSWLKHP